MKFIIYIILTVLITSSITKENEWIDLLDKDLTQWETYLSFSHKNGYNGAPPVDENGKEIIPVGYNKDDKKVFSVIEEKGQPILKVSGEVYGCVYTKNEYENYHLRLKVKWGEKNMNHA